MTLFIADEDIACYCGHNSEQQFPGGPVDTIVDWLTDMTLVAEFHTSYELFSESGLVTRPLSLNN